MPAKRERTSPARDPLSKAVGARIVAMRAERNLTPQALAEAAGMDPNYLWRIEDGRQNLGLRNLARLARALGVTLSELLDGIDVSAVDMGSRRYSPRAAGSD